MFLKLVSALLLYSVNGQNPSRNRINRAHSSEAHMHTGTWYSTLPTNSVFAIINTLHFRVRFFTSLQLLLHEARVQIIGMPNITLRSAWYCCVSLSLVQAITCQIEFHCTVLFVFLDSFARRLLKGTLLAVGVSCDVIRTRLPPFVESASREAELVRNRVQLRRTGGKEYTLNAAC